MGLALLFTALPISLIALVLYFFPKKVRYKVYLISVIVLIASILFSLLLESQNSGAPTGAEYSAWFLIFLFALLCIMYIFIEFTLFIYRIFKNGSTKGNLE